MGLMWDTVIPKGGDPMLLQFNFSNFKSFAEEGTLDLTAVGISELSHHVVSFDREKVLPVSVLFGANASGKSNVYQAFDFMSKMVRTSFAFGGRKQREMGYEESAYPEPPRFAFSSVKQEPASFEVHILQPETQKTLVYGFSMDEKGVVEEWLYERAKTASTNKEIIYRNRDEETLDMPGLRASDQNNIRAALDTEVLVVSLGAKLKVKQCVVISLWFHRCRTIDYGNPVENFVQSNRVPRFFKDKKTQDLVVNYLGAFDESIQGFTVEELPKQEEDDGIRYYVESLHKSLDGEQLIGIDFRDESAGTLKMFSLIEPLFDVLRFGSVLFVDELNARLHPLLVRNLILTFTNQETNPNHAQLIFTSHDTWHLANNTLRRDEIWFTDKDKEGRSTLYSLAEFRSGDGGKIRKDENYEKNYLLGKYRAIPSLKTIQLLFDDFTQMKGEPTDV